MDSKIITVILLYTASLVCYSQSYKEFSDSLASYESKGDRARAIEWALKAETRAKEEIGVRDSNYINLMEKISKLYMDLPDFKKAMDYRNRTAELAKSYYGELSLPYATSVYNLGVTCIYAGDWEGAEPYYLRTRDLYERVVGKESYQYGQMLQVFNYIYRVRGDYLKSAEMLKEAKSIFEKINKRDNFQYWFTLSDLATILDLMDKAAEVLPLRLELNGLIERGSDKSFSKLYAHNLRELGSAYSKTGKYDSAEYYFRECLDYQQQDSSFMTEFYLESMYSYAEFLNKLRKYDLAEDFYKKIIDLSESKFGTRKKIYSLAVGGLGNLYTETARFYEARPLREKSNQLSREIDGERSNQYANSLSWTGVFYWKSGDLTSAFQKFKQSLEIKLEVLGENHLETGYIMRMLGFVQEDLGNYEEAENLYLGSHNIISSIKGTNGADYSNSLNSLATFYETIGQYDKSLKFLLESAEIDQRLYGDTSFDYAYTLNNLGHLYWSRNEYDKAGPTYLKALGLLERTNANDYPIYAKVLNNLAVYYTDTGDFEKAEEYFKKAIDIYKSKLGEINHEYCWIINQLGNLYVELGKYPEAEQLLIKTNETRQKIFREGHMSLVASTFDLARLYDVWGKPDKSLGFWIAGLDQMKTLTDKYFTFMSENEKSNFYHNQIKGHLNKFYSFATDNAFNNQRIIEILFDSQLMFKGILFNSSRKITDNINNSKDLSIKSAYENWRTLRYKLANAINKSNDEPEVNLASLDSMNSKIDELEKVLSKKSSLFNKEFVDNKYRWKDVRNALGSDEAAIEIIRMKKNGLVPKDYQNRISTHGTNDTTQYVILVLTKQDLKYVLISNGNNLEKSLFKELNSLIQTNSQYYSKGTKNTVLDKSQQEKILQQFYMGFWNKIEENIPGISKIYISFDGVFNQLNPNIFINPKTGSFLLQEIDLRPLSSTRDLIDRQIVYDNNANILVNRYAELYGDPVFDLDSINKSIIAGKDMIASSSGLKMNKAIMRSYRNDNLLRHDLKPLPDTRKEIENISGIMMQKNWQANMHLGNDASEESVKAVNSPQVLHIATHGRFMKDIETGGNAMNSNPLFRSMLFFTGAENTLAGQESQNMSNQTEDGLLTAYEAQNLNLENTDLVVLSACETGLGEVKNGEGVYGLQRAFQVAGAKSLIMSLWSVSDKATQELMTDFYSHWLGGMTKREAFRTAQLDLKQKYPDFYFWGAFVMVGE